MPCQATGASIDIRCTPAQEVAAEQVAEQVDATENEIDAVVTWVDSTDRAWQANYEAVVGRRWETTVRFTPTTAGPETELSINLEKMRENLPWIRTIYVLTQRPQRPKCMDTVPNARIVFHDELGLPAVFNSLAIETSLHLIPGLSTKFLYLNDDFYVLRPLPRDAFFRHSWVPLVRLDPDVGKSEMFMRLNRRTLDAMGLKSMSASMVHWPYVLTHAMMEDTRRQLGPVWNRTRDCRLRYTCDEINPVLATLAKGLTQGKAVDDPKLRVQYPHKYYDHAPREVVSSDIAMVVVNNLDVDKATLRKVLRARTASRDGSTTLTAAPGRASDAKVVLDLASR